MTAFSLIIDHHIMEQIRTCTEEVFRVCVGKGGGGTKYNKIRCIYCSARGAYEAKNLDLIFME